MGRYAIDTETFLIGPGRGAPRVVCLSVAWFLPDGSIDARLFDEAESPGVAYRLLTDPGNTIVGHNLPYDLGVLSNASPESTRQQFINAVFEAYDQARVTSTDVTEKMRLIGLGHLDFDPATHTVPKSFIPLSYLIKKYLGLDVSADKVRVGDPGWETSPSWRLRYHLLSGKPFAEWPTEATRYALEDAIHTLQVDAAQLQADGGNVWPDTERQQRNAWALHLNSLTGYRTDPAQIARVEAKNLVTYTGITRELIPHGIFSESGSRNIEAIRTRVIADYATRGMPPPLTKATEKFPAGQVVTDREVLEGCADPVLVRLSERGKSETYLTKYIPKLKEGIEWPINPRYNVLVATGRTSGAEQQHPRDGGIRECIKARSGNVLLSADYAIAELRALAQVLYAELGWSKMADALRAGRELHLVTAAQILEIDYSDALTRYESGDKAVKDARQLAKAENFGLPGGLGARAFVEFAWAQYHLRITEDRASELKRGWLDLYPEVRELFKMVGRQTEIGGGRYQAKQWRSGRLRGDVGYCDGCNTLFQGLVADFAKNALYEVARACFGASPFGVYDPLYNYRPILFYHDEIVAEGREAGAHEAAMRLKEIMEGVGQSWCPDIPIIAEPALSYCYSKEAKAKHDKAGRLIPYERWAEARKAA